MDTDLDLEQIFTTPSHYTCPREFIEHLHRSYLSQGWCQLIINSTEIRQRTEEYSRKIKTIIGSYQSDEVIFIVVMHGANNFFNRLSPNIFRNRFIPYYVLKLRCSSYGDNTTGGEEIKLEYIDPIKPDKLLSNHRKIIIIEDILEKGQTIRFLVNSVFKQFDVEVIGIFSLVDKTKGADLRLELKPDVTIERGIVYDGPLFLYGSGPDLLKHLRDLLDVWGITPELFDRVKEFVKEKFPNNSHQTSQNGCPV